MSDTCFSVEVKADDTYVFRRGEQLLGTVQPVNGLYEWCFPETLTVCRSGLAPTYSEALEKLGLGPRIDFDAAGPTLEEIGD